MGTFFLLTAEAAEHSGGFGLNLDILETNLINLLIIYGVLFYFGRGFLGKILSERKARIEEAIKDAEQRKQEAAAALADEQQRLAQAQTEAARIRAEAEERAKATRDAVLVQAQEDMARMRTAAAQDLSSQQERITNELRQQIAALALQQVESHLRSNLSEEAQYQLLDRSIAMIGGSS
ncbi:MAG: F0F1 ATP synthase subunit B [Cyanobacteria bacterium CRU_2_1]|nr:F0F1 ATP synthase subunit B [Cyanobacteria bacterium RU_5_0]NJR60242.1 F0F1 ATP synthase subunit B [Cyanobacteria bacterium CRU_2_1]